MCMCVGCIHVHMGVKGCCVSGANHLCLRQSLTVLDQEAKVAGQPQGSPCLCFSRTWVRSVYHNNWLFTWVLRIELRVFVFARARYLLSHLLSFLSLFSLKSPGPSQLLLWMELCAYYICTWPLHTSLWNKTKKIIYKSRVRLESTIGMTGSAKATWHIWGKKKPQLQSLCYPHIWCRREESHLHSSSSVLAWADMAGRFESQSVVY